MLMSYEEFLNEVVKKLKDAGYRVELQTHEMFDIERVCFHVELNEGLGLMISSYGYWLTYVEGRDKLENIVKALIRLIKHATEDTCDTVAY